MLKTDGLIFLGNIKYLSAQQSLWGCVVKICKVKNQRLSIK